MTADQAVAWRCAKLRPRLRSRPASAPAVLSIPACGPLLNQLPRWTKAGPTVQDFGADWAGCSSYPRFMSTTQTYNYEVAPAAGMAPPVGAPPAGGWVQQGAPVSPPPGGQRPSGQIALWTTIVVLAVGLVGSLIFSIVALTKANTAQLSSPATTTVTAPVAAPQLFNDDADRALCQAIPDLMRERDKADQAYQALPPTGSPERSAAMPAYKQAMEDWARRMQKVIAEHATPDRYLTRTLQRYVDDKLLYSQNIYPARAADKFDGATWDTGVVSYGGALGRCNQLGLVW